MNGVPENPLVGIRGGGAEKSALLEDVPHGKEYVPKTGVDVVITVETGVVTAVVALTMEDNIEGSTHRRKSR